MLLAFDMSPSKSRRRRRPRKKSNRKKIIAVITLCLVVIVIIVGYYMLSSSLNDSNNTDKIEVLLETSMGDITLQLRDDRPVTTENFINLVSEGIYDNTIFRAMQSMIYADSSPNY